MTRHDLRTSVPTLRPSACKAWTARPWISTADFAERHFRLVTGPDAGLYFQHARSPYARMIMDIWDQPWVRELIVMAPSQTTKTTIAYVCLAAELWRDPSPAGIGMPDEGSVRRVFEEKLARHYQRSPELAADLLPRVGVQVTKILLQGSTIYGMWSGSEASMSSVTMRVQVLDEEDANTDRQAVYVMMERVLSYPDDSKILRVSKPRGTAAESSIARDMQSRAQVIYEWEVCCPDCGVFQLMSKDNIVLIRPERDPAEIRGKRLARYKCEHCGSMWTDAMRNRAVSAGRAHSSCSVERPEVVGVHLPSWLSPQISLSKILSEWFEAFQSGVPAKLIAWDNNHRAMAGNVITLETSEDRIRAMVTDRPSMLVPADAWCLTAGIDVQMVGFWFVVRAWGRDGTSWLVQYGYLDTWADVDALIDSTWPVESRDDVVMPLWRAGIDIGGHEHSQEHKDAGWSQTEETKNWLYERESRELIYGTKGASRRQDQVVMARTIGRDPDAPARYQTPITIRHMDTDYLKCQIMARMHRGAEMAPMWLHAGTGEDYVRQICSEKQIVDKQGRVTWEEHGANHLFDAEVIAAACAHVDWAPNMRQSLTKPDYRPVRVIPRISQTLPGPLAGRRINPWMR